MMAPAGHSQGDLVGEVLSGMALGVPSISPAEIAVTCFAGWLQRQGRWLSVDEAEALEADLEASFATEGMFWSDLSDGSVLAFVASEAAGLVSLACRQVLIEAPSLPWRGHR